MTTTRVRISKTTKALIEDLRRIEKDDAFAPPAEYKSGFRMAVVFALMSDTAWGYQDARAYIDKQLAA